LKIEELLTLTIFNIVPTLNRFNKVTKDTCGSKAVSSIAIEVVVAPKSSPLSNEK
jgi:hypothetical protein